MQSYENIFAKRGSRYDYAMRRYPRARDEEFQQLLSSAKLDGTETVADVPAGGGYLKGYLPESCSWLGHEPCSSFSSHGAEAAFSEQLLPLPWEDEFVDVVMSLAGVHHINDKHPFFSEAYRIAKRGGKFILSDVEADSSVAHFLDNYVGRFNTTGHKGVYLDANTLRELSSANWEVKSSELTKFKWRFKKIDDLESFCNELFDISNVQPGQTARAINEILSITEISTECIGMEWSLRTIVCEKSQ